MLTVGVEELISIGVGNIDIGASICYGEISVVSIEISIIGIEDVCVGIVRWIARTGGAALS